MMDIPLVASNIHVSRGNRKILHDVSVTLERGQMTVLIGPNGAGKSTLIDVLCGEESPEQGSLNLFGQPLSGMKVLQRAQQRSVMTQETTVTFAFSVEEVVEMGRECWAKTPAHKQDDEIVSQSIASAQLDHLREARVTEVSGGERQRAAFARVLAQDTPLIFLDEPVAAMDIKHQEHTLQTIKDMCQQGASALVVLHDLSTAAYYADRLVVLSAGRVVSQGPPQEVCDAQMLSEVYETPLMVQFDDAGNVHSIVPDRSKSFLRT